MFRTVPLSIIRNFSLYTQQWYMSYSFTDSLRAASVQWKTPDDGQRNCPKHVEYYSKNKFEKLVHIVGFIIRIYHDARSPERQIRPSTSREVPKILLQAVYQFRGYKNRDRYYPLPPPVLVHFIQEHTVNKTVQGTAHFHSASTLMCSATWPCQL